MTVRLLLDEHFSDVIAVALRDRGYDVRSVVADPDLRGASDAQVFAAAAAERSRIVTKNVKDFRPLLLAALEAEYPVAPLLLAPSRRFPRARGDRGAEHSTYW